MGCLLLPFRLVFALLWRALIALALALVLARIDAYVERRFGAHPVGRFYLARRGRARQGAEPGASS